MTTGFLHRSPTATTRPGAGRRSTHPDHASRIRPTSGRRKGPPVPVTGGIGREAATGWGKWRGRREGALPGPARPADDQLGVEHHHRRAPLRVADALHPSRLGTPVRAVVDSGFFHLFDPDEGDRFVAELARTLSPGGRYYLLAFAVAFPIPHSPRGVTIEEVRERFTPAHGWRVLECQPAEFLNRIAAPVPATCVCVERLHDDH